MSEWGPWIEHDGKGCPCVGQYVHRIARESGLTPDGCWTNEVIGIVESPLSWNWENFPFYVRIMRYRIRKPLGMAVLRSILADIDTKTPHRIPEDV